MVKILQIIKPRKITETGVGHIPQDRHKHGLVLDFSIGHNIAFTNILSKTNFKKWNYELQ